MTRGDNLKDPEHRKKLSELQKKNWQDPKWRETLLKKQKNLGFRNYPQK